MCIEHAKIVAQLAINGASPSKLAWFSFVNRACVKPFKKLKTVKRERVDMTEIPLRRGTTMADRRTRIEKLEKLIKEEGSKDLEALIAKFAYEEGISVRCAKEYLDMLKKSGRIV